MVRNRYLLFHCNSFLDENMEHILLKLFQWICFVHLHVNLHNLLLHRYSLIFQLFRDILRLIFKLYDMKIIGSGAVNGKILFSMCTIRSWLFWIIWLSLCLFIFSKNCTKSIFLNQRKEAKRSRLTRVLQTYALCIYLYRVIKKPLV